MNGDILKEQALIMGAYNVRFICELYGSSFDKWGKMFDLKRGQANSYVYKRAKVPTEVAIQICDHYQIDLKKFYTQELTKEDIGAYNESQVEEPSTQYGIKTVVPEGGLSQKEATALYERLHKAERKVEILLETIAKLG